MSTHILEFEHAIHPVSKMIASSKGRRKVIVLAGPTGVGKTALSLVLAKALGGEVISADSVQVYRGMDIGTAKVSVQDRQAVVHYLIDSKDLDQSFTVCDFYKEAIESIETVLAKGAVPIVVGGAGFYVRSLLYQAPAGPPTSPQMRAYWLEEYASKGLPYCYDKLQKLDPLYAKTITHGDRQKILRALEIIALTGAPVSVLPKQNGALNPRYDFRCWFLSMSKDFLRQRIIHRCDQMLSMGLLEEVAALFECGLLDNSKARHAIGYRQAIDYLQSKKEPSDWAVFDRDFKKASCHYVKQQLTWFHREPRFSWLDLTSASLDFVAEAILRDYEAIQ